MGRVAALACAVLLASGASAAEQARGVGARAPARASAGSGERSCTAEYADFLSAMSPAARALEASPAATSTYLLQNVATYEHVYYGTGGRLRRQYLRHVRHGTGFAYRAERGAWYVATNQHVVEHPLVTVTDEDVEGVPAGSRKVRETVRIASADDEDDETGPVLTKVLADEALDLAVLKTSTPLTVMPYRIGHSAGLRVGNAVLVRGYPLGAFAASNVGRVISTGQPDRERGWMHEDFAVDALLNSGNSGSPVFAVSCRTGELELVGIHHAGYRDAQALNVVVAVDQLRSTLETLQPPRREAAPEKIDRGALAGRLRESAEPFVMPFGERVVRVEVTGDVVRFGLLDPAYPLSTRSETELLARGPDLLRPAALVAPRRGAREVSWEALSGPLRGAAGRLHDALWGQLAVVMAFRDAEVTPGPQGGELRGRLSGLASRIRAAREEQKEILQSIDLEESDLLDERAEVAAAVRASTASDPEGAEEGK